MIELIGSIGWGLLACGTITHVWHHAQLRRLLAMHFDHERIPAAILTSVETVLTVGVATTYLTQHGLLRWFALSAMVLAVGFMAWIARLLLTKSDLPCACSFSEGPTSIWSFARSVCVGLVGVFALVAGPDRLDATTLGERVAILAVGCAVASAIFVLPEAITWPPASKALLARVDAHTSNTSAPNNS